MRAAFESFQNFGIWLKSFSTNPMNQFFNNIDKISFFEKLMLGSITIIISTNFIIDELSKGLRNVKILKRDQNQSVESKRKATEEFSKKKPEKLWLGAMNQKL